jgi:hypothetical protein
MGRPIIFENIYDGSHMVTLAQLRIHLEYIAIMGIQCPEQAMWAREEIDWDINHLIIALDRLNPEECKEYL